MSSDNYFDSQAQLAQWQAIWDRVAPSMSSAPPQQAAPQSNYSSSYDEPGDISASELLNDHQRSSGQDISFRDIYFLAQDVDKVFAKKKDLNEAAKAESSLKDKLSDITKSLASSPNPTAPYSTGKDSDLNAIWADHKILRDLSDMKVKIEALEREAHASELRKASLGENKLQKEVDSLRLKLEELSKKLTPNPYLDR